MSSSGTSTQIRIGGDREQEIRQRLLRGDPVVFPELQPGVTESPQDQALRTIKAEWLSQLAEGSDRTVSVPIKIRNAIIEGPLDFKYVTFKAEFSITRSVFSQDTDIFNTIDFSFATFKRNLSLADSEFHGVVTFEGTYLERNAYLYGAKFLSVSSSESQSKKNNAIFTDICVQGVWAGDEMVFGGAANATFERARFERSSFFRKTDFKSPVTFFSSQFDADAYFDGVHFNGTKMAVNFELAKIGGMARFSGAHFQGEASFRSAVIGGVGVFEGTVFKGKAVFNGAQVRGAFFRKNTDANLTAAVFEDEADFSFMHFEINAEFNGAQFKGPNKLVNFSRTRIEGDGFFLGASFAGEARFLFTEIGARGLFQGVLFGGSANFNGARIGGLALFRSESLPMLADSVQAATFEQRADFRGAQIGGNAEFQDCTFKGPTLFTGAAIAGRAIFRRAKFLEKSTPSFRATKFRRGATFERSEFKDKVTFRTAFFEIDVIFGGALFNGLADFDSCHFAGQAHFSSSLQGDEQVTGTAFSHATFEHAIFDQDAHFEETIFQSAVSFRDASFKTLFFSPSGTVAKQSQFRADIDLRGCTYERIQVDWRSLLCRISERAPRQVPYDRQPYVQMESFFRRADDQSTADKIYLLRWKTEQAQQWKQGSHFAWFAKWAYGFFAHYGERPWRLVIVPPILLLLLGWFVFSRPGAVHLKITTTSATIAGQGSNDPLAGTVQATETLSKQDALRFAFRQLTPIEVPWASRWEATERPVIVLPWYPFLAPRFVDIAAFLKLATWGLGFLWVAAFKGWLQWTPRSG